MTLMGVPGDVRDERRGYDWSAEPTHLRVEDVPPRAVEEARRALTDAGDSQSRRRAELSVSDLLRECATLDGSYRNRTDADEAERRIVHHLA